MINPFKKTKPNRAARRASAKLEKSQPIRERKMQIIQEHVQRRADRRLSIARKQAATHKRAVLRRQNKKASTMGILQTHLIPRKFRNAK